jgi:predicted nucleic acid-binding protein
MKDNKVFLDSNILVYSLLKESNDNEKYIKTLSFIQELENGDNKIIISPQVLNETYNVLTKKYKQQPYEVIIRLKEISSAVIVVPITMETVKRSWLTLNSLNYSIYDSLILASALENECSILYSEDLSDGHIINELKIINPYKY